MGRQKGSLSLASNIEPKMNAPLDGRTVVNTINDLTANGSFPYFYEGMSVYVKGVQKSYQLVGNDPTVAENWQEAGGGDYEEMTAEEYDALTTAEKNDGTARFITDEFPVAGLAYVASKFNPSDIYTTTEKIVGRWIDGKPLYQKCIPCISVSFSANDWTTITANNVLTSCIIKGGWVTRIEHSGAIYGGIGLDTNNAIKMNVNVAYSLTSNDYVVVQYTKTTDEAIAIGSDTDYSTTEKIVGSWIDGKPLYKQTIDCGQKTLTPTLTTICTISDVDTPVSLSIIRTEGAYKDVIGVDTRWNKLFDYHGNVLLSFTGQQSYSDGSYIVTVEYTKTTD